MSKRAFTQAPAPEDVVRPRSRRAVVGYANAVFVLGLAVLVFTTVRQVPEVSWASWQMGRCYLLAVMLVLGEMRPLLIARADGDADRLTVSTTFSVALVLIGPIWLALVVQALAAGLDDIRRRMPLRAMFNMGQYLITLSVTRLVFSLTAQHDFLAPITDLQAADVVPALLAAAAFFLTNNGIGRGGLPGPARAPGRCSARTSDPGLASRSCRPVPVTAIVANFSRSCCR